MFLGLGAWAKSQESLVASCDWHELQELLTSGWKQNPDLAHGAAAAAPGGLVKALEAVLRTAMVAEEAYLVHQTGKVPSSFFGSHGAKHGQDGVVMSISYVNATWEVSSLRQFRNVNSGAEGAAWHWIIFGKEPEEPHRTLVAVASERWMYYDKYGTLGDAPRRLKASRALQSHSVAAVAGSEPEEVADVLGDCIAEGVCELTPDAARWYKKAAREREVIAEEAREETGEAVFDLGVSLRVTWLCAQRSDPRLNAMMSSIKNHQGFRLGEDGLLEKVSIRPAPEPTLYLRVVPAGQATAHMSWKRWVFVQCHIGVFGGHRSAPKTIVILERLVFWDSLKMDVAEWTAKCLTCIRYKKRPMKQEAIAVKATHWEAWEEVQVDMEGPSNPPDQDGNVYVLTYLCLLCHGVLLEPGKSSLLHTCGACLPDASSDRAHCRCFCGVTAGRSSGTS